MGLLLDTDAFYKLGLCGLLDKVIAALGSSPSDVRRLPALPHMLKRGKLAQRLGPQNCEHLQSLANSFLQLTPPGDTWIGKMTGLANVDPGEAMLFAACIEQDSRMLTADKRAIQAVSTVEEIRAALSGRLITLEAALLVLEDTEDLAALKAQVAPAMQHDSMLRVCFSVGADPKAALRSYLCSLASEVGNELLWLPPGFGDAP